MALRDTYNKVKLLSEKGATEGERQAAKEALKRMEERHPELISPWKSTVYISSISLEDIYKGYQPNITFDEASNLSDEVWKQAQEQLDYFFKKNGWAKTEGTWIK